MLSNFLIKHIFRQEPEIGIFLGTVKQKGSTIAYVNSANIWRKETLNTKIKSIFTFNWIPSEDLIQTASKETLNQAIYGYETDYNEGLFKINSWHNSQHWNLEDLTEFDKKKSESLDALTILIRTSHRRLTSNSLHISIAKRAEFICVLLHPMVVKIPVTSVIHYVDIHSAFAFNEIRKANFPNADDLISYIYELQFIQQKIALSLHELVYLIDYAEKNKSNSLLIKAELSSISEVETIFAYLKASIEKTIVIIGLTFGIKNLETKKTHKSKIDALIKDIPQRVKELFYYEFVFNFISSESLDSLNNHRTGILHKKGISDLQPHSYLGKKSEENPLKKMFSVIMQQHAINSAVLIGTYAMLTDELVRLVPPDISPFDIPY
ncbi:hypothetical protein GJU39_00435 [Pedobacter petrophilus]|uniref:Uncharacterized protein n=1 Tax=Pedobacter petrophilus TaxID=1908241 RepID=A0A7K0FUB2_9SPHI|nr:hypothetical protein [Pedobacter petrophilus]MRX74539.1 hypothetical protein [Pedobacter petrophilus]